VYGLGIAQNPAGDDGGHVWGIVEHLPPLLILLLLLLLLLLLSLLGHRSVTGSKYGGRDRKWRKGFRVFRLKNTEPAVAVVVVVLVGGGLVAGGGMIRSRSSSTLAHFCDS
jgi:hypothetical protein